jgi:reactive intermediate/imine deaminase
MMIDIAVLIEQNSDMKFIDNKKSSPAHYSAAVIHNGLVYVSGQISVDPATGKIPEGGVVAETRQALSNLETVLTAAGAKKTDVLQCRVYTPDVELWGEINAVYAEFFGSHKPARSVVPTTKLHYGCLIEIEAVAAVDAK